MARPPRLVIWAKMLHLRMQATAAARREKVVMSTFAWRKYIIFGAPLVLGILELGHPAVLPGDNNAATIMPIATWWTVLHVLQVPLFALLGIAVFLIVCDLDGRAAVTSQYTAAVFAVVYPAFDAAVGVASGVLCGTTITTDLEASLQELFWGPVTGLMAIIGSSAWLTALLAAAWAWRQHGAPILVSAFLAISGVLLAIGHIRPFGPLACASLLAGAVTIAGAKGRTRAAA